MMRTVSSISRRRRRRVRKLTADSAAAADDDHDSSSGGLRAVVYRALAYAHRPRGSYAPFIQRRVALHTGRRLTMRRD